MIRKVFTALALATAMMGLPAAKAADAPLQIGVTIWPGWMPWWIVEEKGYFDEVGVKANIVKFKRHPDDMSAFAGKQLDATHMILADVIIPASKGVPGRIVLITDESSGADGIIAKTGIDGIKDFKGKRVAYELGGVSQLILMRALEKEGLTLDDVSSVNMSAEDAGTAFLAGAVDVAVTWEPYLSQASKDGKGRVVFSTADTPGLVPDLLVFRAETIEKRSADVQKVIAAWNKALAFIKTNRKEAVEIMAKGAEISAEEMEQNLAGIKLYSLADNVREFGAAPDGPLFKTADEQADFLLKSKLIDSKPDVPSLVAPQFVGAVTE
ncbi:NitT/TauT family transport system substrate-binding protein [Hyphomicrobium facile]|uniref:NitT/TauT family transport system substrate-binding protein n=2 Tax=Hyphomicrobium facile TaxID=51670 RepID=A0A1I7NWL8_9HYPH|nr:NitT/TauT family transport system substrate-binding protein [Hyphomicrobium facile]